MGALNSAGNGGVFSSGFGSYYYMGIKILHSCRGGCSPYGNGRGPGPGF